MSTPGNHLSLHCLIDNDIFCSEVDNKKVKRDPEIGGKRCWVDNRATTKLNVPRLNSFLRDLKALCIEFGANDFSFENTLDADPENPDYFTEKRVMIDGKYYYYEDIEAELEKNGYKELPQK